MIRRGGRARMAPRKSTGTGSARKAQAKQVRVGTPNKAGAAWNVRADKYEAMKKALLRVVPRKGAGVTQQEMADGVRPLVSREMFPAETHWWWMKSVQLNLEKEGVLARDPKAKPLRWTRVK